MTAKKPRAWLTTPLDRLRKPKLIDLIKEAHADGHEIPEGLNANRKRIRWLQECRQKHWDQAQTANRAVRAKPSPPAPPSRAPRPRTGSLCQIPASEVNAWLRTLPATDPC